MQAGARVSLPRRPISVRFDAVYRRWQVYVMSEGSILSGSVTVWAYRTWEEAMYAAEGHYYREERRRRRQEEVQ